MEVHEAESVMFRKADYMANKEAGLRVRYDTKDHT
jgi:hypothetical protein